MPSAMRAYAQNLPTGRYYVQVASTSSMVGNNYKFTIAVTGQ